MPGQYQEPRLFDYRLRLWPLLILSGAVVAGFLLLVPPFKQPLWYHDFADQRCFCGIPHTFNVLSNIPFVLAGAMGLWFLAGETARQPGRSFVDPIRERRPYQVFFLCMILTGFGSAYYHSDPNNNTLLWDRMPLAMAFMAFLAIVISERVSRKAGTYLFWPLVALGAGSVIYWHQSELQGAGDLRIYLLVQFYPLLAIPLLLFLFPARYTRTRDLFGALAWYAGAKVLEILDRQVYAQGGWVSGHTLKHLLAAAAPLLILYMLMKRRPVNGVSLKELESL